MKMYFHILPKTHFALTRIMRVILVYGTKHLNKKTFRFSTSSGC